MSACTVRSPAAAEPAERQLPVSQLHIREGNLCCIVFAVQNYQKVQARYGEGRPFPLEQSVAGVSIQIILEHGVEFVDQAADFLLPLGAADTVLKHHRENLDVMGVQNFFSNMVRFLLLQEGKAPEETVEKLQACETVEEAQQLLKPVSSATS